jgi:eukaryotic-like serine/threonine-protein kinase
LSATPPKDDPDSQLVLNVLDSDEFDASAPPDGPPELVGELVRLRAIMQAFDSLGVAAPVTPPPIPSWGPFTLREQVGSGRFGTVCRAFDPAVQREVAVKLYAGKELPSEPRLMARVRHPNVVSVFGAAVHEGRPGIWMEFIHGQTLGHRVQADGPLAPDEVLRIGIALCDALAAVHAAQLIHQDVKPRNVIQEDSGRVVLMDFGAGLHRDDGDIDRISGTPVFMAPEVVLGARPSVESDVYSLGVLLYYVLTGTYPVYAPNLDELRRLHERHHRTGTRRFVATLHELRPEVSPALARCLAKALAPAGQRYKTAEEFETALETVRLGVWERPRKRLRLWAAVVTALLLGGLAGWRLNRPEPPASPILTRLTSDSGLATDPAISTDGRLLTYASNRFDGRNLDIWVQQMAGGAPLRLTNDSADEWQPSFSPDGSRIVFRSERDGGGLFVVPTLGGEPHRITREGRWPRFSPDGRHIAYVREGAIVLLSPEGHVVRELPVKTPPEVAPVWSPDSRYILVTAEALHNTKNDWGDWDWVLLSVEPGSSSGMVQTGASDILGHRPRGSLIRRPSAWSWVKNKILFDATLGDVTNLFSIEIDPTSLRVTSPPKRLTTSSESQYQPTTDPSGRMMFSTRSGSTDLWELSLDAKGRPLSEAHRLWLSPGPHLLEGLSEDGRWLAFASNTLGTPHVLVGDLEEAGKRQTLTDAPWTEGFPVMARDGGRVFFQATEGDKSSIQVAAVPNGVPEKVCDDCGFPTDVAADGGSLLVQRAYTGYASLALLELGSKHMREILSNQHYTLYRGRFSRDGRWILFHGSAKAGGTQEFIAPLKASSVVSEGDWIAVTDGRSFSDAPRWSLDSNLVYYVSNRDGYLCIWAQRLEPLTKRPSGEPFSVYHSHGRQLSLANLLMGGNDIAVARDKIVFGMGETRGNIWSAEFR